MVTHNSPPARTPRPGSRSPMRVSKPGIAAGPEDTTISFEGRPVPARTGESLAAALIAAGHYGFRRTATTGERGVFCGMGVCSECALQVSGEAGPAGLHGTGRPRPRPRAQPPRPPARPLGPAVQPCCAARGGPRSRRARRRGRPRRAPCRRGRIPGRGQGAGGGRAGRRRWAVLEAAGRLARDRRAAPGCAVPGRPGVAERGRRVRGRNAAGHAGVGQLGAAESSMRSPGRGATSFVAAPSCWRPALSNGVSRSPDGRCPV